MRTIDPALHKRATNIGFIKKVWNRIYNRMTLANSGTSIMLAVYVTQLAASATA